MNSLDYQSNTSLFYKENLGKYKMIDREIDLEVVYSFFVSSFSSTFPHFLAYVIDFSVTYPCIHQCVPLTFTEHQLYARPYRR